MVAVLGLVTLFTMPRSEDPELDAPLFPVVVIYPGTSPEDMEELVVKPLEKRITELEDIKRVKSSIKDGVAVIEVEYKHESDVDSKHQELQREISDVRNSLPANIHSIEVRKISPSDVNVLQLALISNNAPRESMKKQAERLQDELEKLTMLKKVEIHGLPEQIVRVELQLNKLAQMNIPLNSIIGSLQGEITNIPGGSIEAGVKSFNIKTSGTYKSLDEIKSTIVYAANNKIIALKDVAEVYFDFDEQKHITRLNGNRAVFITAAQKPGFNITETQQAYKQTIDKYKSVLPANMDLVLSFDQADHVNKRLKGLGLDFIIAISLVLITLLPLGGRASLVVMISIPLSLAIGLILLNAMGYNLNQLSIVGFVVALGLLVDDSIVVVENIERWLREGHSKIDAAIKATKQIGQAVVGCTATLIIAFLPLMFLPEDAGDFIRSLPMAVVASVFASMVVSLTIIPFLSSRILKSHAGHPEGNIFLRTTKRVINASYAKLLNRALQKPAIALVAAAVIFVGSLQLFGVIGFSLFPASEKPQFLINVVSPLQSNIGYTDTVVREVETELSRHEEIKFFASNVGKGNPRIYYNVIPENERTDFAEIFVQMDESVSQTEKLELIEELRQRFAGHASAKIEVKNFEQGPPIIAPVEVRLMGDNLDSLRVLAGRVEEMLKQTEGTLYVNNPVKNLKSDIKVKINKEKAHMLGVPVVAIDRTVRMAVAGLQVGTFSMNDNTDYSMLLTTPKQERATLAVFDQLFIDNMKGSSIPLYQLADLQLEASPLTIDRYNKTRMVAVSAFVQKNYLTDRVLDNVMSKLEQMPLPNGYSYMMGGEIESREESFGGFGTVLIITFFLFIAVLILEFKTFKSTLIVLSVIPLGIVGAVTALFLTGNTMSFVAFIGLIALAGIEVKNSILLVDFTNQLREQGKSLDEAIKEAGEVRFLPIILTSLTAIGGLIPIAISTNPLISPLAIVIIGGLISSTLLARVVTPVVYKLIPPRIEVRPLEA